MDVAASLSPRTPAPADARARARWSPRPWLADAGVHVLLRIFAASFELRPSLRRWLRTIDGPLRLSVGLRDEAGTLAQSVRFEGGHARATRGIADVDATLIFRDEAALRAMLRGSASELLLMLLRGEIRTEGNLGALSLFSFLLGLVVDGATTAPTPPTTPPQAPPPRAAPRTSAARLRSPRLAEAPHLEEPYLAAYTLEDFPRLERFLAAHFDTVPEICPERATLLTRYFRATGFEHDREGRPRVPVVRQGLALAELLRNKQPLVREGDLLAGTTTSKPVGVVLYPDAHGLTIWGELRSVATRPLNPYRVAPETIERLHRDVFPFWMHRSFREHVRERHGAPLCQRLDERFAVYFSWKTVALSHTVPDFPRLLRLGVHGVVAEIDEALGRVADADGDARDALAAMRTALGGLLAYAENLAAEARREAVHAQSEARRQELLEIAAVCDRVPAHGARTLHEALQSIWLAWIALHMENTNAGLSLGRLDAWLQPYFEADLAKLTTREAREAYVRRALELVGCFFLRCTDHLPLVPDIGNHLFGGSSSDQAITLGGVKPDGESAVCDMTYVILKVTELLKLRDPNVNARHALAANGDAYLRRLCEVNLVTGATPSIHGDEAVIRSLAKGGYTAEHARDWSATGCVEPTISGRHMGHTGSTMFNLVAPLEMALHDGRHPLLRWTIGPRTGAPESGAFPTFERFFEAYSAQLAFLTDQAVEYNDLLGEAHATLRPTPLLSSLVDGAIERGRDVTRGGARYNTSGVACIGLADVVDSLLAIEALVYGGPPGRAVSFATLKEALASDFVGHDALLARITRKLPKFGSGDAHALAMANRVAKLVHDGFAAHVSYRGGRYTTGFWSMSNHVAFGGLTGALPSGRRAGKAFTPGLTPTPGASKDLLDNLRDVAALEPTSMDNNVAFNVKYVPALEAGSSASPASHARAVEQMLGYAKGYFTLGGMQMQLNVVSSAMLRDAMEHPEQHRDLLVRISGYNAYFVTLNREMQRELIERAEFRAAGA